MFAFQARPRLNPAGVEALRICGGKSTPACLQGDEARSQASVEAGCGYSLWSTLSSTLRIYVPPGRPSMYLVVVLRTNVKLLVCRFFPSPAVDRICCAEAQRY